MEIGPFIKLHRIKKNMTQEELAEGIVSESYLSKIENQKTEASPEVITMLSTRLGVQLNNEDDSLIKEKSQEWFDMLFEINSKEEMTAVYNELQELMDNTNSDSEVMFEIHKIRYYLVIGENNHALGQLNKLRELSNNFNRFQEYFWLKFNGNYNSLVEEFNNALRFYRLAEEKINQLELPETEIADLQYTIAVTYSKLRYTLESIDYASQSLEIYRKNYNFRRCSQCHILLGISYRQIRVYNKAIKNYNLAHHLAKLNKDQQTIQLTNQNLGYLYATKGDRENAIKFFKAALDDKEAALENKLITITSLISEYYGSHNFDEARKLVDRGIETMKNVDLDRYKLYDYELKTYLYALDEENDKYESFVIDEFVPFLKKQKDYANIVKYANMVGKHYEQFKKYKNASKYYKLANFSYQQLINI